MKEIDYELSILKELVAIDTDVTKKTGYSKCASLISKRMSELGLKVEILDPVDKIRDGKPRPNVIGTLDVGAKETIGLVTHYDVVPLGDNWTKDPFNLTVDGDKAYGRGAADDKSAVATCLGAIKLVRDTARFNIELIASPEEEIGGKWGIGYIMGEVGLKFDFGVVVDSMPNMISIGASGIIQGEIRVFGKQGHAGYPHRADNPIPKLSRLIIAFDEFARMRERKLSIVNAPPDSPKKKVWGRISFTMMGGGVKENIIPGEAWTRFDMRLLPDEDPSQASSEMLAFFNKAREELRINAKLSFGNFSGGYLTNPSEPFIRRFAVATASVFGSSLPIAASLGGDDGKFIADKNIPVISYGAIAEDSNFHGVDEFVYLKDLQNVRDVFVHLIG
jgi:succinyl-diaminopimelate desuccinylase